MKICLVYHGEFPPAERIEKIAKTLTAAGHRIYLLCNNYGKYSHSEEVIGDVYTIRIRPLIRSRKLAKVVKFPVIPESVVAWGALFRCPAAWNRSHSGD